MNRDEMLGPAVSPDTGEAYEPGTGYKGMYLGGGIILFLAIKIGLSFANGTGPAPAIAGPNLASEMKAGVARLRSQLPMKVDEFTTLTDVSSAGTRITYTTAISEDIPTAEIPQARTELQALVERQLCGSDDGRRLIRAGGTIAYRYVDESRDTFDVAVSACPAPAGRD